MKKINNRQNIILNFIYQNPNSQNNAIREYLGKKLNESVSRVTIVRDINFLLKNNLIKRYGSGRNISYMGYVINNLLKHVDIDDYFSQTLDKRELLYSGFNFDIFKGLNNLFSKDELQKLNKLNDDYKKRVKRLSPTILKKEIERLTIDLSWKSSKIEGNTYSLIDTEILIKENKEAEGHTKEESIMLLNHKDALDYIFYNKNDFKVLILRKIENIHSLLIKNLNVKKGLRKNLVGITGTNYKPLDNQYQIKESLENTIKIVNNIKNFLEKSLIISLMISYIQPFEDGNKRASRLLSNAVLIANNFCPLSFRGVEEADYKKAIILFYEQNNVSFFKELFIKQFEFSISNYFL